MKSKTEWVIIDSQKQVMECTRCGNEEPLSILTGRTLSFASKIMLAYVEEHKDCKP